LVVVAAEQTQPRSIEPCAVATQYLALIRSCAAIGCGHTAQLPSAMSLVSGDVVVIGCASVIGIS
jgi:hypothetical protein